MPCSHRYFVYILSSDTGVLCTGVTNNLERRLHEHQQKLTPGFTSKYNITRLIYFEETSDIQSAIAREKEIKSWRRSKKLALIRALNPQFLDLSTALDEYLKGRELSE